MPSYKDDIIPLIRNKIALSVFSVASVRGPTNTVFQNLIPILMWTTKRVIYGRSQIVLVDAYVFVIDHSKPN